jgi:thiamine biosynthesis lipoprotein
MKRGAASAARIALACLLLPLQGRPAGPVRRPDSPLRLERSGDAMGAAFTVVVYGDDEPRMISAVENAFDEVRRIDRLLSNYRPSSEWSEVNRNAAKGPVKVSEELFELLSACLEYSRQSEGAFDITVGPLMKLWGFYRGSGRIPHRAEIRSVFSRIGYKNILLNPAGRTVRFARNGVELDPGGIGKGYAVDRMAEILRASGIRDAFISGSASSLYAMGAPPHETGWRVQIRDPRDSHRTVEEVILRDESMSTSGSYEKFFRARGKLYTHIMDPRTGYPATGMLAVSVIAPRTLDSEAWTKPLFVNGRQWAAAHKPKGLRAFFCEDRVDQPCAWLQ